MNINKDNSLKSKVRISCHRDGEKTLLGDRYFDMPYKLIHYGHPRDNKHLEILLMCASPGIMGGDSLQQDIHCEEGVDFKYFTQSFNKIHPILHEGTVSSQICNFTLEENARFFYVPHPTIPFRKSAFEAINTIKMKSSSHLIWGDIIGAGRIHSGERFELTKYHTKTKVFRDDRLILFDNQLIDPANQPVEDLLFFEGYTHQGTLLMVSPYAADFKKELDEILLEQFTDSSYGFTLCAENALMLRIMGSTGEALHDWLFNIGNMAWNYFNFRIKQDNEEVEDLEKPDLKALVLDEPKVEEKVTEEIEAVKKTVTKKATAKKPVAKKTTSKKAATKTSKTATTKTTTKKASKVTKKAAQPKTVKG